MQHPVDGFARRRLPRRHQDLVLRIEGIIVGDADGVDAGRQHRAVSDAIDALAIDEHARLVAAQTLAKLSAGHQHGISPGLSVSRNILIASANRICPGFLRLIVL